MKEQAQDQPQRLWQMGALFHNTARFSQRRDRPQVDRLASILRQGLVAPAASTDGAAFSDLNIVAEGFAEAYDKLVFLHRYGEQSWLYTFSLPGHLTVFLDPATPVITPADLAPRWVKLSQDEVYVREHVPLERFIGMAVHPDDAEAILAEFRLEFERLNLPLYLHDGKTLIWPH